MTSLLARGLPLSERLPAPPAGTAAARAGEPSRGALSRLVRWRRQDPFPDAESWRARLDAELLDERSLLALLDEDPDALASRTKPIAWGDWVGSPMPPGGLAVPDLEEEPFLSGAAANLIAGAGDEVAAHLRGLDLVHLLDQFTEPLLWQVHGMLARTLALEVNLARLADGEQDDGGAQRFHSFLAGLGDARRQRELFLAYPVLTRQLDIAARQWAANAIRLADRIVADAPEIARRFAGGAAPGPVVKVTIGTGDRHCRGQSVAIVGWESGLTAVYKPRPMALDVHFGQLLGWLNAKGFSHPLRAPRCLARDGYGWAEFVTAEPCTQRRQIHRFYHRQGALLALLELLRGNDMHAENLIASGEHPVLIDLETLLQPGLPLQDARLTGAQRAAAQAAQTSVLQVGLLPTLTWHNQEGEGVDVSGIGRRPGQKNSLSLPALHGVGTDTMRVRMERVELDLPDHRPVGKQEELNLLDYAGDITAGYTEMHRLCCQHREQLLAPDGPLEAFRGDRARIVIRSTMVYAMLLSTGFHPDVLRDGMERDRHFDYLWRRQAMTPLLGPLIAAERRDLWRNDVPYFCTVTGSSSLLDSDGAEIAGFPVSSGLDLVRQGLRAWDDDHLAAQLMLIRRSLSAAAINSGSGFAYPDYRLPEPAADAALDELRGRFLAEAVRIGEELERQAYADAGSAQWLGLSSQMGRNWSAGPLGPDLFNGVAGVAVFLAQLGAASGHDGFTRLAAGAVATMRAQLRQELAVTGGMSGVPGMAWALCRLARLLGDEELVEEAASVALRLLPLAGEDRHYDIVSGSAGTIAALRLLHRMRPEGPALSLIAAAAHRLRVSAAPFGPGVGWIPSVMAENGVTEVPPAGLGHGAAGIAWALAEASALLGEPVCADLAREAIAYEQTRFLAELGSWDDVRQPGDPGMIRAWCHGSVGIGLARIAGRHALPGVDIDRQIDHALADSLRHGFGLSHAPCHGDTGVTELLLASAEHLGRPALLAQARQWGGALLQSIEKEGWICGVPNGASTPSLMVGLSGIGYGLLRLAEPARVPSVLLLDPHDGA